MRLTSKKLSPLIAWLHRHRNHLVAERRQPFSHSSQVLRSCCQQEFVLHSAQLSWPQRSSFRCANSISTFFRSRRYCLNSGVPIASAPRPEHFRERARNLAERHCKEPYRLEIGAASCSATAGEISPPLTSIGFRFKRGR